MRTLPLLVALTVLPLAGAQSQEGGGGRPNTRQGFWIGFGLGGGSTGTDCDSGCNTDRANGFSGYLRMGGTVSSKVLLGGETNGWAKSENGIDESLGFASFIVMWYPSATGAFYLKGGLGGMSYMATDGTDEFTATAPSVSFGLGYEVRVSRNMSVTPFFNGLATSAVEFKFNGNPLPNNNQLKVSLAQVGVGLTWH